MKKVLFSFFLALTYCFLANAQIIETSDLSVKEDCFGKWRVAVQAGPGFRIGKVQSGLGADMDSFLRKLKKGYSLSADVTYYFLNVFGVGFKAQNYHASNSANVQIQYNSGERWIGTMTDKIDISFLGPFASYRWQINKHSIILGSGLGYLHYKDKSYIGKSVSVNGGTLGLFSELNYDYSFTNRLAFGVSVSLISGSLSSVTTTIDGSRQTSGTNSGQKENISNIAISVGLRLNL